MKEITKILLTWQKPYISGTDLCHFLDKSPNSRHSIIKRATREGLLLPLRRDLYLIIKPQPVVDTFEVSSIIYGPSYLSFESALSFHGWIPEAVKTTTCATSRRSKEFETPIGFFSYVHIPITVFALGVGQYQKKNVTLFIADPWKALADIIYARKRTWPSLNDLSEDLRIDTEHFTLSNTALLADLIANYPSNRVKKNLHILQTGVIYDHLNHPRTT